MPERVARVLCLLAFAALCACGGRSAHAVASGTATPLESASVGRGRGVFAQQCAVCHGAGGAGGQIGPALRGIAKRRTADQIAAAISDPSPPMPKLEPAEMSQQDLLDVTAYVQQL